MSGNRIYYRYSTAFKQKVISEIESGQLTVAQARRIYDINGSNTITSWLEKYGKNHLLSKLVRIEMKDEKDKFKQLESQKKQLESALAQAHLKILCLESLVECAEEHYQIDIKKNFGLKVHRKSSHNQTTKA